MGKKDAEDKRTERHFSEEVRHWTKQERVATMFLSMPGPGAERTRGNNGAWNGLDRRRHEMNVSQIMCKMIAYSQGNHHDINHLMKVYAYARTIGVCVREYPGGSRRS